MLALQAENIAEGTIMTEYASSLSLGWNDENRFSVILEFPNGMIKDYPKIANDVKVFDVIGTFCGFAGVVINMLIKEARTTGCAIFER